MLRKGLLPTAFAFAFALALSGPAQAFHCPQDMAAIDAALPDADLSDEDMTKVKELRAQGEEEQEAGNHPASVKTLSEAKKILGID